MWMVLFFIVTLRLVRNISEKIKEMEYTHLVNHLIEEKEIRLSLYSDPP